jgi:hypothetical protein
MSETKFTPGPWALDQCGRIYVIRATDCSVGEAYRSDFDPPSLPTKANAALIAAAPDLYAALNSLLKTVVDDLGECGYDEEDIADHEGVKRATSALAKARGET